MGFSVYLSLLLPPPHHPRNYLSPRFRYNNNKDGIVLSGLWHNDGLNYECIHRTANPRSLDTAYHPVGITQSWCDMAKMRWGCIRLTIIANISSSASAAATAATAPSSSSSSSVRAHYRGFPDTISWDIYHLCAKCIRSTLTCLGRSDGVMNSARILR